MTKPCRYYLRHLWGEAPRFEDGLEYRECLRPCGAIQWARYSLKTYRTQTSGALVPVNVQWVDEKERARMPEITNK